MLDRPAPRNLDWRSERPDPGTSKAPWRVYNIGSANPVELLDYIKALEGALGRNAEIEFLPTQAGDVPDTYADVSNFFDQFGYKPTTTVSQGIEKFVVWYRNYFNI